MSEPTKLQRLSELAYDFASKVKLGSTEQLLPMFLIERDGKREVIGTPYTNVDEKRTIVINVALEIAERGADAWSFLSETWNPTWREGLVCLASDGKETLLYTWRVHRDERGKCTELVKLDGSPHRANNWISVALNKAMKLHEDFPQTSKEAREEFPI